MNTKQLRQKILDLAIRGKLVPQDPNDEPASVLLARVKAEKERLIAEGKIKRSKKTAVTSDKPHYADWELPNGWECVRLSDICIIGTGATPSTRNSTYYKDGTIPWIGSSETSNEYIDAPTTLITQKALDETNCTVYPIGTLIMAMYGEGKTRGQISELRISSATNQACAAIVPIFKEIKSFIKIYLKGNYLRLRTLAEGGMQPNLNLRKISSYMIPMPPLAEQIRIERVLNDLLLKVDLIDSEKSVIDVSLSHVKSKILELAISGKLVSQDPADAPAEVLLKRVNPNAVVSADTSHYALPSNWVWVKGKDLFLPMKSTTPKGDTFKYIDIDSIDNKNQCISAIKVLPTEKAPSRASRYTEKNNVLFSMVRPYLRNIALVTEDECIASTGFYVCRQRECLDHNYLYYLMTSRYVVDGLNMFMKGDNSPSINKGHIDEFDFPLPPLNEQKRIVAKVAELFAQIDTIQQSLE